MKDLCNKCENKGKVNGLSQQPYCSSCIHSVQWKADHFKIKITAEDRLNFILENGLPTKRGNGCYAYTGFYQFQGNNEIEVIDKIINHFNKRNNDK